MNGGRLLGVFVIAWLLVPATALAELELPPGLTARVYVTGARFDSTTERGARGIPATSTLVFDHAGTLYLARVGRRYVGGESEDLWRTYRIPIGGAQLTPETESRYLYGPPLPNPQVGATREPGELFVTTYDRERKVGVLYRVVDGRAELLAGGTPERGTPAILRQPEGVVVGPDGFYVADRARGVIVRLDAAGRVVNPSYAAVTRPRVLALDRSGSLWIGSDGNADAPWQPGPGEIWHVARDGATRLILRGPMPQAIALSPGGYLLVADRHAAQVFAVMPDGTRVDVARFTGEDAPRSLVFAPVTPDTERAGIAGDLFVAAIRGGAWPVNEVLHIRGPLDDLIRQRRAQMP